MLCPRDQVDDKKAGPPIDSFLRACKPTEAQQWAHVLCAVFIPDLTFSDAARMRLVEGASTMVQHRWTAVSPLHRALRTPASHLSPFQRCCICHEKEGAVVKCHDCNREFHVSCAWDFGHKFGFEIQPVRFWYSSAQLTRVLTSMNMTGEKQPPGYDHHDDVQRRNWMHERCDIL